MMTLFLVVNDTGHTLEILISANNSELPGIFFENSVIRSDEQFLSKLHSIFYVRALWRVEQHQNGRNRKFELFDIGDFGLPKDAQQPTFWKRYNERNPMKLIWSFVSFVKIINCAFIFCTKN
jgi:hypothetical protein